MSNATSHTVGVSRFTKELAAQVRGEALRLLCNPGEKSLYPLAGLRIGLGLVLLVQWFTFWTYRDLFFGRFGLVQWVIAHAGRIPYIPTFTDLWYSWGPYGVSADGVVSVILVIHLIGILLLLIGLNTRMAALGVWLTLVIINESGAFSIYGLGSMELIASFYCLLMPVGQVLSLDGLLRQQEKTTSVAATYSIIVLRTHLCVIYATAGISKLIGLQWWTGDALWRALSFPAFAQFDVTPFASVPAVFAILGIAAMGIQFFYPVMVCYPRTRAPWVLLTEMVHVGIGAALGLWLFSAMMIVLNMAAFGDTVVAFAKSIASYGRRRKIHTG